MEAPSTDVVYNPFKASVITNSTEFAVLKKKTHFEETNVTEVDTQQRGVCASKNSQDVAQRSGTIMKT